MTSSRFVNIFSPAKAGLFVNQLVVRHLIF